MTGSQWTVVGIVGTLILSAWGLVYLAKASARESLKAQAEAVEKAVNKAVADATTVLTNMFTAQLDNLRTQLTSKSDQLIQANAVITARSETIERRDARINYLEDQLYGKRQT